jgi:hypothetical protein
MEDLKDIIREITKYKTELGLKNISDDMILDCSTRIFNNQNINKSKKENIEKMNENKSFIPATEKQKFALKEHNFKGDISKISKEEARQIISEYYK